jgi:hypothetical protein
MIEVVCEISAVRKHLQYIARPHQRTLDEIRRHVLTAIASNANRPPDLFNGDSAIDRLDSGDQP